MQEPTFKKVSRDDRQEECRRKWILNKCRGTLIQPTGCGKTTTALKCLKSVISKYPEKTILVVVPTDNLKIQWRQQLDNWGMEFNTEVQVINTVIRRNWKADILCLDEVHRYGADTFKEVFSRVQYKYILGLTATFERLDGKHAIMQKYCPVIDEITLFEAKRNGWISDFTEYQVLIEVPDIDTYKEYNKNFVASFEFFNFDWNLAMSMIGPKGFISRAKYRDEICKNGSEEQRKQVFKNITFHAMQFMRTIQQRKAFINNHPKKLEIARKIIASRPNSRIITFSNNIKMAEAIGMGGKVYSGKDSKKKGRITLEEFQSGEFNLIHSIAKLNEGADLKGLSVAIILGMDSSEIKAVQRRGRCIRFEEGKRAEIFNLVIADTVESKWFSNGHPDGNYVTIDENGLNDVLEGKEPRPYKRKIKDFTFRY